MNNFVNQLRQETQKGLTENNAVTNTTSLNAVLDLFAMGGALRNRDETSIVNLFDKAFGENQELALKCLFYLRDIRAGQGERRTFKVCIKHLANTHPDKFMHLLHLIPEYGRYDDLYQFVGTPLEKNALSHLQNAAFGLNGVTKDILVFKWLKSENTSSAESKRLAKITREHFGLDAKSYRKLLSASRKEIKGLVEIPMSKKEFGSIDYSQVPSKAGLKYREAFYRNDEVRYNEFLTKAEKGEVKINTAALYPSDIVGKILSYSGFGSPVVQEDKALETMWNNLPNYVQEDQNALVVADTSGSMSGQPMNVSVALAIYFAERNKGPFKDCWMNFSSTPTMQKLQGTTLARKIANLDHINWQQNTDLQAVFDLVLNTAIKHRVGQNEMPKTIYIVSDMEFDSACRSRTNFEVIEEKYSQAGYVKPHLVFWNVNSRQNNVAVSADTPNTSLVSGYSPSLFKQVMEGKTPVELMVQVLSSERYSKIKAV